MDCGFGDCLSLSGLETTNPRERIFLGEKFIMEVFFLGGGGGLVDQAVKKNVEEWQALQ